MQNVHKALHSLDKDGLSIHVSTSVGMDVLERMKLIYAVSLEDWTPFVQPIIEFLAENKLPLMVNVFSDTTTLNSSKWTRAFDAAVETFYTAMDLIGYPSVPIVVSSTGFPSTGGEPNVATTATTLAYNQCLVRHNQGRRSFSRKPNWPIPIYLFALFNFKRYPGDKLEWGLFDFNMCPVYRQGCFS
ncbi:Glucan endo-1-3-beta-glucosidase GIII [Nymphaea thermarum]|nr:Glucan endo-1-3-beta-glucosidase GIII [Nymphaea thermarum]